jgi:hypothetical protein
MPLGEMYEVEIDVFDNLNHNHDRLPLTPLLFDRYVTNPFKLEERNFPVDLGHAIKQIVIC